MSNRAEQGLSQKPHKRQASATRRTRSSATAESREKKHLSLTARMIVVALVIGLVGTLVFFVGRHFNGAWAARDAISSTISKIEEADTAIVDLNNAVASTVDEATAENAEELVRGASDATGILTRADESLARANALDEFLNENELAICDASRDSIDARREMIGAGEAIVSVDAIVGSARGQLEQAIKKALEANTKSQEASAAANEYAQYLTGDESVATKDANNVVTLDNEVISLISEAKESLNAAKETFGDADYSAYETYLDKRAEAAQLMLDADNALVSGDFASASDLTAKYNEADTAATELAAALPASTSEIFSEPYASLTNGQRETYSKAAAKATEADKLIRHYQGINVSTSLLAATTAGGDEQGERESETESALAQTDSVVGVLDNSAA